MKFCTLYANGKPLLSCIAAPHVGASACAHKLTIIKYKKYVCLQILSRVGRYCIFKNSKEQHGIRKYTLVLLHTFYTLKAYDLQLHCKYVMPQISAETKLQKF